MSENQKNAFYAGMFDVQMSYLHHRMRREPWWGMEYGLSNFTMLKVITKYVDGERMDLDEMPWRQTLANCWQALMQFNAAGDREKFVAFLRERFGARWMSAYPVFEAQQLDHKIYFGCFRYDYDAATNGIHLHFQNRCEPASPFESPADRQEDLRRIVRDLAEKNLKPVRVGFETWMNNLPPVAALFPESYAKSLVKADEFPKGYGWWGQFITKDGALNRRRAELMKQEGRFEYARLNGHCPWDDFQKKVLG